MQGKRLLANRGKQNEIIWQLLHKLSPKVGLGDNDWLQNFKICHHRSGSPSFCILSIAFQRESFFVPNPA